MTSTPYQTYNPPPPPGFSVTPQLNDDWAQDATPQFQSKMISSPRVFLFSDYLIPYCCSCLIWEILNGKKGSKESNERTDTS